MFLVKFLKILLFQTKLDVDIMNFKDCLNVNKFLIERNKIPLIIGNAGIGKTAIPEKIAKDKGWGILTIIPVLMQEIEVNGIPFIFEGTKNTVRSIPELIVFINSELEKYSHIILFIDELSRATTPVQNAFLNIFHKRMIGEHIIPENCHIVTASNYAKEDRGSGRILKALEDRVTLVDYTGPTYTEWVSFEQPNEHFAMFLKNKKSFFKGDTSGNKYISPRTLSAANKNLIGFKPEEIISNKIIRYAMNGDIGTLETTNFLQYVECSMSLFTYQNLLDNNIKIHEETSVLLIQIDVLVNGAIKDYVNNRNTSGIIKLKEYILNSYGQEYMSLLKGKIVDKISTLHQPDEVFRFMRDIYGEN